MTRALTTVGLSAMFAACASVPVRSGPLIDDFSRSPCIRPGRVENVYPPGWLAWDYVLQTRCHARVVGAQGSTGSISVEYLPDTTRHLVAGFGEKSNPVEVRVDPTACRLYVKANGSPMFTDRPALWLLEYDLLRRREVQSVKVEPEALPATCARMLDAA
jgi:hypothetical protein